jgi:hypothetical protein
VDDSFRLANFFRTGARHQLGQRGLGGVDFGPAHRDLFHEFAAVEPRHQLTSRNNLAFGDSALLQPTGDLETHLDVGDLDVSGNAYRRRIGLVLAPDEPVADNRSHRQYRDQDQHLLLASHAFTS